MHAMIAGGNAVVAGPDWSLIFGLVASTFLRYL
jgi:hypothetical protein